MKILPIVQPHESEDWCHLCGSRKWQLADVWFSENAEHAEPRTRYLRMCTECAKLIYGIAKGEVLV